MNVRYRVELSQAERDQLTTLLSGGKHAARKLKRAQILLAADAGASDEDIATGGPDLVRRIFPTIAVIDTNGYRELTDDDVEARSLAVLQGPERGGNES